MTRSVLLASVLAVLVGCSVPVGASDASAPSGHAVYAVTRTTELGPNGSRSESNAAVARFIRSEPEARALELVGAALALPEVGACLQFGRARLPVPSGPVELADPGAVVVRVGDRDSTMTRRHLPDVADLVRGSVFTSNAADLPAGERYEFRSAAGIAQGEAPQDLAQLRVGDDELLDGMTVLVPRSSSTHGIDLTWSTTDAALAAGQASSLVYVDIAAKDGVLPTTRCTFEDRGRATLPVVAFDGMKEGLLSVHRVRREFRQQPSSELRFDFAVRASFHTLSR
ncbi:MAG: hypothetical protein U0174_04810 [Polyangiaceae bacterium]